MNIEANKTYKSFFFILVVVLNACLGSFFVGYKLGELNLLVVDIKHIYNWSTTQTSIYTGILNAMVPIGAILGAIVSGNLFSKIGRKWGLIIADVLGFFGSLSCIFIGNQAYPQIIGRLISGIACGINCQLIPLYINELTPIEISGFMGSFFQSSLNIGIMISYIMGLNIPDDSTNYDTSDDWWKFVFGFPMITCIIRMIMLLIFFRFDTPYSLIKQKKEDEVSAVMKKLYQDEYIDEIVQNTEIKINSYKYVSFKDLFSSYRSRLLLGVMLMVAQQLSGLNAVVTESSTLYDYNGDTQQVKVLTVMNSVVLFIASFASGWTSDIFGRRSTVLGGNFSCVICMFLMATFMQFSSNTMQILSIGMTYIFLFCIGISLGPVAWLYQPEILPDKGVSLAVIVNWCACGVVLFSTPILIEDIGISALYFIFWSILVACQIYLHFFMKETKGKSSTEIDEMFLGEGKIKMKDEGGCEEEMNDRS